MEARCSPRTVITSMTLLIWGCPALPFAHPTLLPTGMISQLVRLPLVLVVPEPRDHRDLKGQQGRWGQPARKVRLGRLALLECRDPLVCKAFKALPSCSRGFGRVQSRTA